MEDATLRDEVGVHELRDQLSRYLERVRTGVAAEPVHCVPERARRR
jgi:hypothetical protein